MPRAVYVGVGQCACGRIDERLYHTAGAAIVTHPVCGPCLVAQGGTVPVARTASDIISVDGKLAWRMDSSDTRAQIDLGGNHTFEAVFDSHDHLLGWLHNHPDARSADGMLCQSFCAVRPLNGSLVHQIIDAEPLSLEPAVTCRMCGAQGRVTQGLWVPA